MQHCNSYTILAPSIVNGMSIYCHRIGLTIKILIIEVRWRQHGSNLCFLSLDHGYWKASAICYAGIYLQLFSASHMLASSTIWWSQHMDSYKNWLYMRAWGILFEAHRNAISSHYAFNLLSLQHFSIFAKAISLEKSNMYKSFSRHWFYIITIIQGLGSVGNIYTPAFSVKLQN